MEHSEGSQWEKELFIFLVLHRVEGSSSALGVKKNYVTKEYFVGRSVNKNYVLSWSFTHREMLDSKAKITGGEPISSFLSQSKCLQTRTYLQVTEQITEDVHRVTTVGSSFQSPHVICLVL